MEGKGKPAFQQWLQNTEALRIIKSAQQRLQGQGDQTENPNNLMMTVLFLWVTERANPHSANTLPWMKFPHLPLHLKDLVVYDGLFSQQKKSMEGSGLRWGLWILRLPCEERVKTKASRDIIAGCPARTIQEEHSVKGFPVGVWVYTKKRTINKNERYRKLLNKK